jgi:mono/diheme cytochrome c family protein
MKLGSRARVVAALAGAVAITAGRAAHAQPSPPPADSAATSSAPEADTSLVKVLVKKVCGTCHELGIVTSQRKSPADWDATVTKMMGMGAQLTDDQADEVVDYLARTYRAPAP